MGYANEIVIRARGILARQRADRESENASRQAEAYRRVPRLRELDRQLRQTMAMAAQAVFSQGADMEETMNRARQENQALQAERKALLEAHFPQGWLDENPACPHCGDTGYIGANMCRCLREICAREQRKELGVAFGGSERFETFRLDYYPDTVLPNVKISPRALMAKNLKHCREYARFFSQGAGNLLLSGTTGLGKTHLALSIGYAVGEQGYSVCYETAASLFAKLERARFSHSEEAMIQGEKLENCDLLIIDDLGTEMPGQFVTAALYALLNQRLLAGKPMVITTNLTVDEMAQRYSPQIASRMQGEFYRMPFLGNDIRVMKNGGTL